jgi:predicted deacylase
MIENFDRLHGLPDGFFDITTANIRTLFPNPTLIQLDGRDRNFLFISILQHGNEYSGLRVMQRVLAEHARELPRSILLFIGNVRAAEANLRQLPDQVDYNRCWPGTLMQPCPTSAMMRRIIEIARGLPLFAALDIHNNTGKNPHYTCISDPNGRNQNLAAMSIASPWYSGTRESAPWPSTASAPRQRWNAVCPGIPRVSTTPAE